MNATTKIASSGNFLKYALRLEAATLGWMVVEASASIGVGIAARSVLLIVFGIDSVIELISASVLYWRLRKEATTQFGESERIARLEKTTARISGYLLYALTLYVAVQAGYGLLHRHMAESSWVGFAVAIVAAVGMPLLAREKIRVADQIGSKALKADAIETFTCGYLSWVLLAGLTANALFHLWWLDSAAAFVLIPFLIKEGRDAISGECSCHP